MKLKQPVRKPKKISFQAIIDLQDSFCKKMRLVPNILLCCKADLDSLRISNVVEDMIQVETRLEELHIKIIVSEEIEKGYWKLAVTI